MKKKTLGACHTYLEQLAHGTARHSVLHKNSAHHAAISELQHTLHAIGFGQDLQRVGHGIDGSYDAATATAMRHFYQHNGL